MNHPDQNQIINLCIPVFYLSSTICFQYLDAIIFPPECGFSSELYAIIFNWVCNTKPYGLQTMIKDRYKKFHINADTRICKRHAMNFKTLPVGCYLRLNTPFYNIRILNVNVFYFSNAYMIIIRRSSSKQLL